MRPSPLSPASHGPRSGPFVFLDPAGRRWRRVRLGLALAALAAFAGLALFLHAVLRQGPSVPAAAIHQPHLGHGAPLATWSIRPDWPAPRAAATTAPRVPAEITRVAWHAPWDARSWHSLRQHAQSLDAVAVEWMSLTDVEGHLRLEPDEHLEELSSADEDLAIYLVLNNLAGSRWQPEAVEELARSPREHQEAVLAPVWAELDRVGARGLVVHFEGLDPDLRPAITALLQAMAAALHAQGRELWLAVPASREKEALDVAALAPHVDRFVALLHTETASDEPAGPLASQPWFEGWLAALLDGTRPEQWIAAIGNHGSEWREGGDGQDLAFADAMERARRAGITGLGVDAPLFQPGFTYEAEGQRRTVWFQDAVTFANQAACALRRGVGGILLYRLGHEDPGVWAMPWDQPATPPTTIAPQGLVAHVGHGDFLQAEADESPGERRIEPHPAGLWRAQVVTAPRFATVVHAGAPQDPAAVVLTFDDGPDPRWTPAILDILKARGVPAVFFVTGRNAERHPELIERIRAEGHLVANHSFFHPDIGQVSAPHAALELLSTTRLLEALTGTSPRLFRPPYLRDSLPASRDELTAVLRAQEQRLTVLGQSIDPRDYERPGVDELVTRVAEQRAQGAVLLLHDGGGDRSQTVAALPRILDLLAQRGDRVVPAWELADGTPTAFAPPVPTSPETTVASIGFSVWRLLETGTWWAVVVCTALVLLRTLFLLAMAAWQVRRERDLPSWPHPVSILVPAHNEALTIAATVQSLLAQDHAPGIEVLVLDDGSTDGTAAIAEAAAAGDPRVRVLRLPHGGKAAALNHGIHAARHEVLVLLDADTQLAPNAVASLAAAFHDPAVGAVSGTARAANRGQGWLPRWQDLEYLCGFNLERRACHVLQGILVVPGAIGAWRTAALQAIGGFATDTLAEDTDATIALQRAGWRVLHEGRAVAWTQVPANGASFVRQRFRWTFGTMQALWKHRAAMGKAHLRGLSLFTMPGAWFFQVFLVLVGPLLDLGLLAAAAAGLTVEAGLALAVFLLLDMALAVFALAVEGEPLRRAWQVLPMRLAYRPLLAWAAWKAALAVARGLWHGWTRADRHAIPTPATETAA